MRNPASSLSLAALVLLVLTSPSRGATGYVANDGVDGTGCFSKATPCRSITKAIENAARGDKIVVGPGRYGDLNNDGVLGGPGEEMPSPGCGCMLSVNKAVSVTSSDGAAATLIDARGIMVDKNVLLIMDGGEFGRPGRGFTVTSTADDSGSGIVIDSNGIAVRGNLVVGEPGPTQCCTGIGIDTVESAGVVLIEANLVIAWNSFGITARGTGKTVRKNQISGDGGIDARGTTAVVGNLVTGCGSAIRLSDAATAIGNASLGNRANGFEVFDPAFTGTIEKNNIFGNVVGLNNNRAGLVATNNYWGAPTGPGPAPANPILDEFGGSTTATPFATKPFKVKVRFK